MRVDMKFEVAIVPVSDVDRAKAFYTKLGWRADDDIVNGAHFRAVQLTPPGSAASVTFGKGVTDAKPGSFRGGLIVSDILAALQRYRGQRYRGDRGLRRLSPSPLRRALAALILSVRATVPTLPFRDPMAMRGSSRKSRRGRRAANCRNKRRRKTASPSPSYGVGRQNRTNGGTTREARIDDKRHLSSLGDDRGCVRHNLLLGRTKRGGISGTAGIVSHSDGRSISIFYREAGPKSAPTILFCTVFHRHLGCFSR